MKTVLFIHYPLPPLVWGWRGVQVAKYLNELSWRPICLGAEPGHFPVDDTFDLQRLNGLQIHRVAQKQPSILERCWRRVSRKLKIGEDFPDSYRDWFRPAFREACLILDREKVDLIYSLSPTYTTAYVAMALKKKYGIPWVTDFRDPWSINCVLKLHYGHALREPFHSLQWRRIKKGENAILKLADKVIYPTEILKEAMQNIYRSEAHKMEALPTGYDESSFHNLEPKKIYPDQLTITFLGCWYLGYREPIETFLDVLNEIDPSAQVVFIGRGAVEAHQLNRKNVTCMLQVSREKSHAFAMGSDFLLVVMPPSYRQWMLSKLYTYLRIGRPILALVPEDSGHPPIIREANAGFVLSFDRVELKKQLQDILNRWKKGEFKNFQPNRQFTSQFEQKVLTGRLAKIFDKALHPC